MSTDQIETPAIDKSTWGDGPWQQEPDRLDFVHAGYACLVTRHPRHGHLCGYVGVDETHPLFGDPYQETPEEIDVHGGLTYSARCSGQVCHVPAPGMPEDVWWFGFDAAHGGDLSPGIAAREREYAPPLPSIPGFCERYRSLEYMRCETESLAEQLRALASQPQQPALFAHAPEPD